MAKKKPREVGKVLVSRLERFSEQLESAGSIEDLSKVLTVRTVRRDLAPRQFSAEELKAVRSGLQVSQPVLAAFLGVAVATLRDWEQGATETSGPACRVLEEMQRDMAGWSQRIRQLASAS